jgi:hypothetical protein
MGREDPIEFYIVYSFLFNFFVDFSVFCWGDGKINLTLLIIFHL